jgi:hypothetical protein
VAGEAAFADAVDTTLDGYLWGFVAGLAFELFGFLAIYQF